MAVTAGNGRRRGASRLAPFRGHRRPLRNLRPGAVESGPSGRIYAEMMSSYSFRAAAAYAGSRLPVSPSPGSLA